jgi:putative spermidine/putrescine transport system permease protein
VSGARREAPGPAIAPQVPMSAEATTPEGRGSAFVRRASAALFRHPRAKLGLMLGPPLGWMVLVYLASLALLLVTSFWRLNELSSQIERVWGLQNYRVIVTVGVYRTIVLRTVGMAAAVTVADLVLAFPISYYIARLATPRVRSAMLLAVVMPLWSNYLIRMFSWKILTAGGGPLEEILAVLGIHKSLAASNWAVWLTFCYLWLPFAILPLFAAFERVPESLLEASGDLGARGWLTFRRVIVPIVFPGMVAASIFTFSLTLGDYITPTYVGKAFFIGNTIYNLVGLASNLPFAAALAMIPVVIMAVYMAAARRLGAFEAL